MSLWGLPIATCIQQFSPTLKEDQTLPCFSLLTLQLQDLLKQQKKRGGLSLYFLLELHRQLDPIGSLVVFI